MDVSWRIVMFRLSLSDLDLLSKFKWQLYNFARGPLQMTALIFNLCSKYLHDTNYHTVHEWFFISHSVSDYLWYGAINHARTLQEQSSPINNASPH